MKPILAADNIVIEPNGASWQLRASREGDVLAEVREGALHYSPAFAMTRHLPDAGVLPTDAVLQVVLGWQKSDECWHLGLLLAPSLAERRKSRWCGFARWPDPFQDVFQELGQTAGETLAQALGVPFTLVPPPTAEPAPPPRALPPLPLSVGLWHVSAPRERLIRLTRARKWRNERLKHAASNLFWAVVYALISLLTLNSPTALPNAGTLIPNPQWLPYLGLLVSVGLVFSAIWQVVQLSSEVNRIDVDGAEGRIVAYHDGRERWTFDARAAQSVYVSEVRKRRDKSAATEHGELNLHTGGGKFKYLFQQEESVSNQGIPQPTAPIARDEGVYPLTRDDYRTALQAVGLLIAEALGVSAWHDLRYR
jgi:hypothetical protein